MLLRHMTVTESKRRATRETSFNSEPSKEPESITTGSRDSVRGFCTLCRCDVDVSSQRKAAVERHAGTDKHKSSKRAAGTSSMRTLFREVSSPLDDKIPAAGLCRVWAAML